MTWKRETNMNKAIPLAALMLLFSAAATLTAVAVPSLGELNKERLVQLVHENHAGAAKASGVVDAVDATQRKLKVSHGAIKQLGWPAMTMDFVRAKEVELSTVKAGMKIDFTLSKGSDGAWTVDTLKAAAKQ